MIGKKFQNISLREIVTVVKTFWKSRNLQILGTGESSSLALSDAVYFEDVLAVGPFFEIRSIGNDLRANCGNIFLPERIGREI